MTTENDNKKEWGGKREGSGRKKTSAKTIGLRIPQDVVDILAEAAAEGIKSTDYIVAAIRAYHAANREDREVP